MKDGYEGAEYIVNNISKRLEINPVTQKNARQWLIFCRVIKTNLDIIERHAYNIINNKE